MSDSPTPERDARGAAAPGADGEGGQGDRVESEPASGWQAIEEGVGHMIASFERGVIDSIGGRGAGQVDHADAAPDPIQPAQAPEPVAPRPGATYDEVLRPTRWRNVVLGLVAVVLLGALYWLVTLVQVVTTADEDQTREADAIIVLGAAQFDGTPSPVLAARLDHALELWNDGWAEFIVTTGSKQEGDRFTEGFSGFVYLREAGVPESAILNIIDGADTYQQMTASQAQMVERGLTSALLVSDGYHSYRLLSIADEIGLDAAVSPTTIGATQRDYFRETSAVSIGRLLSYRRLSAWSTDNDPPT